MRQFLLLVLFIYLILASCKKTSSSDPGTTMPPPPPLSDYELQRIKDSTFNAVLIPNLGNIYQQGQYPASQSNIPIYKFIIKNEPVYFYGSTDAQAQPSELNGFTVYKSNGEIFRMEINRKDSLILLHNLFADTSKSVLAIEIRHISDSVLSISVFKVNSNGKNLLYERLRKKSGNLFRTTNNRSLRIAGLKSIFEKASDNISEFLNGVPYFDLLEEFEANAKNSDLSYEQIDQLNKITGGTVEAERYMSLATYFQKLDEARNTTFSYTPPQNFEAPFSRWFYELTTNNKFSFEHITGEGQTITYGKTPAYFKVFLKYEGLPFVSAKVEVTETFRGRSKSFYATSDQLGTVTYQPESTSLDDEHFGKEDVSITFKKLNDESKKVFTIALVPRPRLHLVNPDIPGINISGNNQEGYVDEELAKPLKILVWDEESHNINDVELVWEDKTQGITSSGFVNGYTKTSGGIGSSNTWKMKTVAGTHIAKVSFKYKSTEDYVTDEGFFSYTAIAKMEPASISLFSGNNQTGQPNTNLTNPLKVLVKDNNGQPMSGVNVTWAVTAGGGQFTNITTTTGSNGESGNTWKLGATGAQSASARVMNSNGNNITGSPVTFVASINDILSLLRSKTWVLSNSNIESVDGFSCGGDPTVIRSILQSAVLTFGSSNGILTYTSDLTGIVRVYTGTMPCSSESNTTVSFAGNVDVNLPVLFFSISGTSNNSMRPLWNSTIVSVNENKLVLISQSYSGQLEFNAQ
jgi:hypothetical protein